MEAKNRQEKLKKHLKLGVAYYKKSAFAKKSRPRGRHLGTHWARDCSVITGSAREWRAIFVGSKRAHGHLATRTSTRVARARRVYRGVVPPRHVRSHAHPRPRRGRDTDALRARGAARGATAGTSAASPRGLDTDGASRGFHGRRAVARTPHAARASRADSPRAASRCRARACFFARLAPLPPRRLRAPSARSRNGNGAFQRLRRISRACVGRSERF